MGRKKATMDTDRITLSLPLPVLTVLGERARERTAVAGVEVSPSMEGRRIMCAALGFSFDGSPLAPAARPLTLTPEMEERIAARAAARGVSREVALFSIFTMGASMLDAAPVAPESALPSPALPPDVAPANVLPELGAALPSPAPPAVAPVAPVAPESAPKRAAKKTATAKKTAKKGGRR